MKPFLRWFALVILMAVAGWYGYDAGVVHSIVETDISKLSIVIVSLLGIGTLLEGVSAWKVGRNKNITSKRMENRLFIGWFLAETMMVLGLAGTVVGFIVLFQGNFADVSFDDPETVQAVIIAIASGMGVSLYTTIVGIFSSLLLKLQLVNVEVALNEQAKV